MPQPGVADALILQALLVSHSGQLTWVPWCGPAGRSPWHISDSKSCRTHNNTVGWGTGGGPRRCACGSGPSGSTSSCQPAARRQTRGYTWACEWTAVCAPVVGTLANRPRSHLPTWGLLGLLLQTDAAVWCMFLCIWVLDTWCLQVTSERMCLKHWVNLQLFVGTVGRDGWVSNGIVVGVQARVRRRGTSSSGS